MRFYFICLALLIFRHGHAGQFLLTPRLSLAWQEASRLRIANAETLLQAEKHDMPSNALTTVVEIHLVFQKALATGASKDEERFHELKTAFQQKYAAFKASDPWRVWALGYLGMNSLMMRMRAGQQWQAAMEIRRTYAWITEAYQKYPGFVPNKITFGMMQVALGSVPEQFNWALRLASMKPDTPLGIRLLTEVLHLPDNHPFAFLRADAAIMLSMAVRAMQTDSITKEVLFQRMSEIDKHNLMLGYSLAYLLMRERKNEEALHVLEALPMGPEYLPFPLIDYLKAEALLRKGSPQASTYYQRFLRQNPGTSYVPDAHRKLGWIALLSGDTATYRNRMALCLKSAPSAGERDAEARQEASSGNIPHTALLKARLRFDGGYYQQALDVLNAEKESLNQPSNPHHLEFVYRLARISEALGHIDQAIDYYRQTYSTGQHSSGYFAAMASLRLAEIFEQKGEVEQAIRWFNLCLSSKPTAYRSSILASARAGLRRLQN